ncbi:MAG TPA: phosphotransferase [Ktedonobacterales bacterium]|jgi:Ser/Thr protein kinase RdoA (MazF antagonist)
MRSSAEELDAVRDMAVAALAAWGAEPGEWRVVGVVPGSLGAELRPVVELDGARYLVRRQPAGLTASDTRARHAFMRHLRAEGLPVPLVLPRPDGTTFAVVADETYELQEWCAGERFRAAGDGATDQSAAAAACLGALHQASAGFDGAPARWSDERAPEALATSYLDLVRQVAARDDITPAVAGAVERIADGSGERIALAAEALAVVPGPPELHLHGDYQPRNLAFAPEGSAIVTALYDFDAMHWGRRLDEVAYALLAFTGLRDDEDEPPAPLVEDGLDFARADAFLQAYGRVAPPAEGEAPLLPDAIALLFPVVLANGVAEDLVFAEDYGGPPPEADILPRLHWAETFWLWLDRYRDTLAEAWARG